MVETHSTTSRGRRFRFRKGAVFVTTLVLLGTVLSLVPSPKVSALDAQEAQACVASYNNQKLNPQQFEKMRNDGCTDDGVCTYPPVSDQGDGTSIFTDVTCDASKASGTSRSKALGEVTDKDTCVTQRRGTWNEATKHCDMPPAGTNTQATCVGGALGWLLCPLVTVIQDLNNKMNPVLEDMLEVKFTTVDPKVASSQTSVDAVHSIWSMLVTLANLVLVVAFLIVIFSQATSFGLSAYGIKKMLPRIIAAAILINLSFFLCSVAIDIFNVIGASVRNIIKAGIGFVPDPIDASLKMDTGVTVGAWLTTLLGAAAALTVLALTGTIAFILPVIFAGTMATLGLFLGLGVRQVIILLLIVVSPLAFAAMVLPGTEKLFKQWWSSFLKMLALYPIIMAALYGSAMVSKIILAAGQ